MKSGIATIFSLILALTAIVILFDTAYGLMPKLSREYLVNNASLILIGQVTNLQYWEDDDQTIIYTDVTVLVGQIIKGDQVGGEVTFTIPGGKIANQVLGVEHFPEFVKGENVLLYLTPGRGEYAGRLILRGAFQGTVSLGLGDLGLVMEQAAELVDDIKVIMQGRKPDSQTRKATPRAKILDPAPPYISSISPTEISAGTGSVLTINGSNFSDSPGLMDRTEYRGQSGDFTHRLYWGINRSLYNSWSNTKIEVKPAGGGISSGSMRVTRDDLNSNSKTLEITFSYRDKWNPSTASAGIGYYFNPSGASTWMWPGEDTTDARTALDASFQTWENVSTAEIDFIYKGQDATLQQDRNDGINAVLWEAMNEDWGAMTYYTTTNDTLSDVDIVFNYIFANGDTLFWSTKDNPPDYPDKDPKGPKDIQNVGTHEVGHFVGLWGLFGDPLDTLKTMYGVSPSRRELKKRSLEQEDKDGVSWIYPSNPKVIAGLSTRPKEFRLSHNYPNPFNPTTVISFTVPRSSHVRLSIYNTLGQQVRVIADGRYGEGVHEVRWDGQDAAGVDVASGIYLYRLEAGEFVQTRRMVLLR